MTHIGKIGRLSKARRHELALRIEDSQTGEQIVQWLNAQPDVQEILQQHFPGRPITEQNLSDWKQTGHLEWLRRQEASEAALRVVERAEDLDEAVNDRLLSDEFATVFSSEMTRLALALLEQETDPEKRWKRLCEIHRELSQLRRDDHRAIRTSIREDRYRREVEREDAQEIARQKRAHKESLIETLLAEEECKTNADLFGGGKFGREKAEMLYRLQSDQPIDDLLDGTWVDEAGPIPPQAKPAGQRDKTAPQPSVAQNPANPKKSSLIQANPAKKTKATRRADSKKPKCKSTQRRSHSRTGAQRPNRHSASAPARRVAAGRRRKSSASEPSIDPIPPIIPTPPVHKPANIPQLTPEQMRIEEENRLWRIQNHFEDPPPPEPGKEN